MWTGSGWDELEYILETSIPGGKIDLVQLGELLVTPWHPVKHEGRWCFPSSIGPTVARACGRVYSFVLKDRTPTLQVGDQLAITLAHGLLDDIAKHEFWGTEKVVRAFETADLMGWRGPRKVKLLPSQVERLGDTVTGLSMPPATASDRGWVQLAG